MQGLVVMQEGCAPGWEITAHFGPVDVRGGTGFNKREKGEGGWERQLVLTQLVYTGGIQMFGKRGFSDLQSFSNALHLQYMSSQHHLGTGEASWDEEGWLPLIHWGLCGQHTYTESKSR